ncbi:hypothetical protein BDR05DRAFT_947012 [Suillus weaverae]|nr:hypothetical protein BDR05DRAFT_947012 [Suillus weaverae]
MSSPNKHKYIIISTTPEDVYAIENNMFTHQPCGRAYHHTLFYGCGCPEAILTYIPQDMDGLIHIQKFIGCGPYSPGDQFSPCTLPIFGFPGLQYSSFVDGYSVVFFQQHSSLPLNQAIQSVLCPNHSSSWYESSDVCIFLTHGLAVRACETLLWVPMGSWFSPHSTYDTPPQRSLQLLAIYIEGSTIWDILYGILDNQNFSMWALLLPEYFQHHRIQLVVVARLRSMIDMVEPGTWLMSSWVQDKWQLRFSRRQVMLYDVQCF